MSDELDPMADDVYQPDGGDIQEEGEQLDAEDTLMDRGVDDALDEGYSPPERPRGVEDTGTTAEEQEEGESLDERLARENPDVQPLPGDGLGDSLDSDGELVDTEAGGPRAGRLVSPDEGYLFERDEETVGDGTSGEDVGIDGGAASAEEAAVHVIEDTDQLGYDPNG